MSLHINHISLHRVCVHITSALEFSSILSRITRYRLEMTTAAGCQEDVRINAMRNTFGSYGSSLLIEDISRFCGLDYQNPILENQALFGNS